MINDDLEAFCVGYVRTVIDQTECSKSMFAINLLIPGMRQIALHEKIINTVKDIDKEWLSIVLHNLNYHIGLPLSDFDFSIEETCVEVSEKYGKKLAQLIREKIKNG